MQRKGQLGLAIFWDFGKNSWDTRGEQPYLNVKPDLPYSNVRCQNSRPSFCLTYSSNVGRFSSAATS